LEEKRAATSATNPQRRHFRHPYRTHLPTIEDSKTPQGTIQKQRQISVSKIETGETGSARLTCFFPKKEKILGGQKTQVLATHMVKKRGIHEARPKNRCGDRGTPAKGGRGQDENV